MLTAAGAVQAQLYWRVDAGASFSTSADIQDQNFPADGLICGDLNCTVPGQIKDVGTSALLSGGVGWRFNQNFRIDGTVAYRGWYKINETMPDQTTFKGDVSSWNIMANGYWDFVLAWGRPYVGAGIGWASNKVDDISGTNPVIPGITVGAPGGTKSGFAWALMAGVGIPINPNITLDIGGRYVDLGKLETDAGVLTANGIVVPGFTYSGAKGNLKAWELTVGLRFP
jgi:opacity protein-like surface antigen